MEPYKDGAVLRTSQDPSHYDKYQVELEVKIPPASQPTKAVLESTGFVLADFDQWGLTYLSSEDPGLSADVDELDDYSGNTKLVLRKNKLLEYDIDNANEYLEQVYHRIVNKVNMALYRTLYNG